MIVKYMDEQHLNQKSYQALHLLPCMPWDSRFTQCDEPSWLIRQNLNLGDISCASYQKAIPPTSPAGGCCGVSGADDYSSDVLGFVMESNAKQLDPTQEIGLPNDTLTQKIPLYFKMNRVPTNLQQTKLPILCGLPPCLRHRKDPNLVDHPGLQLWQRCHENPAIFGRFMYE